MYLTCLNMKFQNYLFVYLIMDFLLLKKKKYGYAQGVIIILMIFFNALLFSNFLT